MLDALFLVSLSPNFYLLKEWQSFGIIEICRLLTSLYKNKNAIICEKKKIEEFESNS